MSQFIRKSSFDQHPFVQQSGHFKSGSLVPISTDSDGVVLTRAQAKAFDYIRDIEDS